jgi:hypothetical protein
MPRRRQPQKKDNSKIIIVAVIAAIVIVVGLVALNSIPTQPQPTTVASASRDWGSPNAPVTIEEFGDFQ